MKSEWLSFFFLSVCALIVEIVWVVVILIFLKPS